MTQIKQYEMRREDMKLLLLDLKDPKTKQDILEIKRKYSKLIIITLMMMKFSIYMTSNISDHQNQKKFDSLKKGDQDLITLVSFVFGNIFCQVTIGLLTDLISVQVSWAFTWIISSLSIIVNLLQTFNNNLGIGVLGQILANCSEDCIYVLGVYLIYDTSYALNVRFNQSVLFIIISTFAAQYLELIVESFAGDYIKLSFQIILSVCLFLSFVCGITVWVIYKQIELVKYRDKTYQQHLIYKGVGLSLSGIFEYYCNKNMLFLMVLTFIASLIEFNDPIQLLNVILKKESDLDSKLTNFFLKSQNLGTLFLSFFMIKYINVPQKIIKNQYMGFQFSVQICLIISIYSVFFISLSNYLPSYLLISAFFIILVYQGLLGFTISTLALQVTYCLQNEKSQIKCIGLSILGFIQDLPRFFILLPSDTKIQILIYYCIQGIVTLLGLIYTTNYLKDKEFDLLEAQIEEQYSSGDAPSVVVNSNMELTRDPLLNEQISQHPSEIRSIEED